MTTDALNFRFGIWTDFGLCPPPPAHSPNQPPPRPHRGPGELLRGHRQRGGPPYLALCPKTPLARPLRSGQTLGGHLHFPHAAAGPGPPRPGTVPVREQTPSSVPGKAGECGTATCPRAGVPGRARKAQDTTPWGKATQRPGVLPPLPDLHTHTRTHAFARARTHTHERICTSARTYLHTDTPARARARTHSGL